ncbi:MAG: 50S ribosomal protein L4, partial [Candidatus Pacearchaeota archaeon]
ISENSEIKKEIELPKVFSYKIREDIVKRLFEVEKTISPYAPSESAGRRHSASGRIRHIRHKWRTAYGRGISRVPRKTMWRRGTQFYWIGAEVSGTRGGRRAHPPKVEHFKKERKINRKEKEIAIKSCIAATANIEMIKKRYEKAKEIKEIRNLPIIIDSNLLKLKTKEFTRVIKGALGDLYNIAIKEKKVRAGRGKMRGRKYKSYHGALIIHGDGEEVKTKIIESKNFREIKASDFYPLSRLVIYTEKAIKEIGEMYDNKTGTNKNDKESKSN